LAPRGTGLRTWRSRTSAASSRAAPGVVGSSSGEGSVVGEDVPAAGEDPAVVPPGPSGDESGDVDPDVEPASDADESGSAEAIG